MGKARVRSPESLSQLLRSDWEKIISQANLGVEDTQIAEMYLLDAIPQIEIGVALHLTRSTISRRLLKILDKVERTARKIGL